MADTQDFKQVVNDAILDADSLEQFINGSDSETVLTRLSAEYPTLQKALKELFENGGIAGRFETLADLQASPLVDGDYAIVVDDAGDKNGIYIKELGAWKLSKFDFNHLARKAVFENNKLLANDRLLSGSIEGVFLTHNKFTGLSSNLVSDAGTSWKTNPAYATLDTKVFLKFTACIDTTNQLAGGSTWDAGRASLNSAVVLTRKNDIGFYGFSYHPTTKQFRASKIELDSIINVNAMLVPVQDTLKSWCFEIEKSQEDLAYKCTIINLANNERLATLDLPFSAVPDIENYAEHVGVYSGHADARWYDITVTDLSTSKTSIPSIKSELNIVGSPPATSVINASGNAYDVHTKNSEAFLIERFFDRTDGSDIVGSQPTWSLDTTAYEKKGEPEWAITGGGLSILSTGRGAYNGVYDDSFVIAPISGKKYQDVRGAEISADIKVPSDNFRAGVVAGYRHGFKIGSGRGYLFAQLEIISGSARVTVHSIPVDKALAESGVKLYEEYLPSDFVIPNDGNINITLKCHSSKGRGDLHDLVIAYIAGVPCARFLFEPFAEDSISTPLQNIDSVGVAVHSGLQGSTAVSFKSLEVRPLTRVGSSPYRSLPPEPAPVVPNFSDPQVVFDATTDADPNSGGQLYSGILGPSIIPMLDYAEKLGITPVDNYYMYYSPNHDTGDSGIWLATAPEPTGPWTNYQGGSGANRIYVDNEIGSQTEQPQVVYDEYNNRLVMMYHVFGLVNKVQASVVATSSNGIDFVRQGVASDASLTLRETYLKHDGYSSMAYQDPLGIAKGWHGWFRMFGGASRNNDSSLWTTAKSDDGITWTSDLTPIRIPSFDKPYHHQDRLHNIGYGATPFAYRGQRLFPIAPFISSGVGQSTGYLAIVRLGDDMRNMSAEEYVIEKTLPTEEGVTSVSSVFVRGDTLYLYYTGDAKYVHLITADLSAPPKGVNREI